MCQLVLGKGRLVGEVLPALDALGSHWWAGGLCASLFHGRLAVGLRQRMAAIVWRVAARRLARLVRLLHLDIIGIIMSVLGQLQMRLGFVVMLMMVQIGQLLLVQPNMAIIVVYVWLDI